ncbi:hypothetical protein DOTSEDRAFT_74214 [Dothistroma septosporum NZE10]|uniref:Histidine kinase n=1 Tax=Dothistroma septosporum (strain NZE10 / CBS 128990) TaxID=675120 RepID=N1PH00_DOTSN|nr:hypothetical protein DOTSEDRAFT_74214 [Dothistroma septosporum NZE10]
MDDYDFIQQNDPQWLESTLRARAHHMRQTQGDSQSSTAHLDAGANLSRQSDTGAGPFDVTLAALPPGREVSDHVKLLRAFDWGSTTLGPMTTWSTELRRMVNFCLQDTKAAALWWGPQRIGIYNDAYIPVIAHKYPAAVGQPVHEVWPELLNTSYGKSFLYADETGLASSEESVPFYVTRAGYFEEVWATWVMIPIAGGVGNIGYYNTVSDTTQEVMYNRRIATLQSLDQHVSAADTVQDYWKQVLLGLQENNREVPFAALYGPALSENRRESVKSSTGTADTSGGIHEDGSAHSEHGSVFTGTEWFLEGVLGLDPSRYVHGLPRRVDLDSGCEQLTPLFSGAMNSKSITVLSMSDGTICDALKDAAKSRAFEGEQCETAVLLPIWSHYQEHRSGFLILGINTRRNYDADYQRFVRLLHQQLTSSLSSLVMAEDEARRARVAARLAARDRIRLVENLAKSQREATQNESRFRGMADFAPIGIFEFDPTGGLVYANQAFLDLSDCPIHEAQGIESLNTALVDDDQEHSMQQWRRLMAGEEVRFESRLKKPFITDETYDGERMAGETWVLTAAYAMRDDSSGPDGDSVQGIFGCLVDISRQKWMEGFQERQVKEQLERRRQQENFMDSTNHEARNPLAAIMLCADDVYNAVNGILHNAKDSQIVLPADSAHAILESVEIIIACAKHQKRIIDDVLTLSKLDSDMLSISPAPMRPTDVIAQVLKMVRGELQRDDVDLQYILGPSYLACNVEWVMVDSTRLLQVLINLLTNAIKFTKNESSRKIVVKLDASDLRPTDFDCGVRFAPSSQRKASAPLSPANEETVFLCVSVKDTGPGIMDDELQNLFQRFQQASPKTYAQYGGSGLGLWISKELCGKLGGQIGVASMTPGSTPPAKETGTTFCFYVQAPRCPAPAIEQPGKTSKPRPNAIDAGAIALLDEGIAAINAHLETPVPETAQAAVEKVYTTTVDMPDAFALTTNDILIVEDNLVNQRVMRKQLIRAGFQVIVANHGKEALDLLYPPLVEPAKVDVVLMDIEMPIMGGLECTKIIRFREQESEQERHLPILGVTANARAEQQAAAIEAGMDRVVTKPFHMSELLPAIERVQRGMV